MFVVSRPFTDPTDTERVDSPFADAAVTVPTRPKSPLKSVLWGVLAVGVIIAGIIGGASLTGHLNDPYRTMAAFPVAKYLDSHQALAGSKFRAEFEVVADLGWKENKGRLMLFSSEDDTRPIAVLVPAPVAKEVYFTKGQKYLASIEVKEGGLIFADSVRKN